MTGTHIDESETRHQRFYLANDFGFGSSIKRLQHDIEYRLLLGFLLRTNEFTHEYMRWCLFLTSAAASSAGAATGAVAAEGKAISWIFSRDCGTKKSQGTRVFHEGDPVLALSNDTRSAAWRRVKPEISSTIRPILGSTGRTVEDGEASAVVASHLDRPGREASLAVDGT
jgi:hypothetical protein